MRFERAPDLAGFAHFGGFDVADYRNRGRLHLDAPQDIGQFHLKKFLSKHYGKEEGECSVCHKVLLNENCLLQHLISLHGAIDKAIPDISELLQLGSRNEAEKQSKKLRWHEPKLVKDNKLTAESETEKHFNDNSYAITID